MVVPATALRPESKLDFVTWRECEAKANEYLDLHHELARVKLDPLVIDFAIALAAAVAWECAALATRRAKGLPCE